MFSVGYRTLPLRQKGFLIKGDIAPDFTLLKMPYGLRTIVWISLGFLEEW